MTATPKETAKEAAGGPTLAHDPTPEVAEGEAKSVEDNFVHYTGKVATVREITKAQWKGAGVNDQKDTRWTPENDHKVPLEDLSEGALEILGRDKLFKVPKK